MSCNAKVYRGKNCRLFHDWGTWRRSTETEYVTRSFYTNAVLRRNDAQERTCRRCGLCKVRNLQ